MVMRNWLCVGDPPATGGAVLPYTAPYPTKVKDIDVALIGGAVYCEACKSTGVIAKAGGPRRLQFMTEMALDGDICLCKCSPPPPIKATHALTEWYDDMATGLGPKNNEYDEMVVLVDDETQKPLSNVRYFIKSKSSGVILAAGTTDENGQTERFYTEQADEVSIHIGEPTE